MPRLSELESLGSKSPLVNSVIEWDVVNWSRVIPFWAGAKVDFSNKLVLELGAKRGGLSLLFASCGAQVVCSDFGGPDPAAADLHRHYGVAESVKYQDIDATNINHGDETMDAVAFKSILGGIARGGQDSARTQVLDEIFRVLKPGGTLFFAENLRGSRLHAFVRQRMVRWGRHWNYITWRDAPEVFSRYEDLRLQCRGFAGCFGRTNQQRNLLGQLDGIIEPITPPSWRYILFGTARKPVD